MIEGYIWTVCEKCHEKFIQKTGGKHKQCFQCNFREYAEDEVDES